MRPARVSSVYGIRVVLWTEPETDIIAAVRMRANREAPVEGGVAVGDWVLMAPDEVVVEKILKRKTVLLRQAAGERAEPQAIAANVDRVLVATSLEPNGDFKLRRLERYMLAIRSGGAEPIVLLGKSDLCADLAPFLADVAKLDARYVIASARTGDGIEELRALVPAGTTTVMVGSSGVGKSALTNFLLGRQQQILGDVRASDRRGKHTTTRRSLFVVPGGGLLVDTPGMRELKPWQAEGDAFDDVVALASSCRYSDCRHENEPDCAVRGVVDSERLASWEKLRQEKKLTYDRQATHATVDENRRSRAYTTAQRKDRGR